ncbi:MAG: hypothetical protein NZL89_03955 [Leptospiraceae bacterium]|nr:hypothetical protein [Leptospiraceae bacterium]
MFFLSGFYETLAAQSAPLEILRASEAEYVTVGEGDEGIFILRGGIIVRSGKSLLRAETVKINTRTAEVFGEGKVVFESETSRLSGDKFYYDARHNSGVVYSAQAAAKPFYLAGSVVKQVAANRYVARDAFFTTCNEKFPHYYFKAKKLWLYRNSELAALSAIFYVGQTPVFYWPLLIKSDLGTGVITQYGNNLTRGHFLQNTWYFSIPPAQDSALLPQRGKLLLDWYQKVGYLLGTQLRRESADLQYNLDVAIANFRARRTTTNNSGETVITNQVLQPDGSYGPTEYFWYRVRADARGNFHRSRRDDSMTSGFVRFEYYKHRNFELEFGERYEPDLTINAIYRPRFTQNTMQTNLLSWQTGISHASRDTQLALRVERQFAWYQASPETDSRYAPIYDLTPELFFSHRIFLLQKPAGPLKGITNNSEGRLQYTRFYRDLQTVLVKDFLRSEANNQTSFYFAFFPWLNVIPGAGVGMLYSHTTLDDPLLRREMARQSYAHIFTHNLMRIGYPFLYAQAVYHRRYAFAERGPDLTFYRERLHYATFSLNSDLNPYAQLSVAATRDLRPYPNALQEHERWSDLTMRLQADYDFLRGFTANLYGLAERRYNHFNGLGCVNVAAYSLQFRTMNTNDFQFYYRLGGYRLPLLRELTLFKLTTNYRHNFINIAESNLRLGVEANILFHDYWRFRIALNSLADQFERYRTNAPAFVPFTEDFLRSLNPFDSTRSRRILNLENLFASIEHDLHRWLLRINFMVSRRTIYTGSYMRDRTSFLEQTIAISFTLKDIDGFGLPHTEVYRYNPTDAGVR